MTGSEADAIEALLDPRAASVVAFFKAQLAERDATIATQRAELERLKEELVELKRIVFGRSSEKLPSLEDEVRRVVEADDLTVEGEPMPKDEKSRKREKRRVARKKSEPSRKKKRALKKNLPVVHESVDVDPSAFPAGMSPDDFREVGSHTVVRRIEHVREHLVVLEYHLQTLASKDGEQVIKATPPPGVAVGCQYGPGLHAHVATSKCADSIPVHRLGKILERAGFPIPRSTLNAMFHRAADVFKPVYDRLLEYARADIYVHADETTLNVQNKGGCLRGWVWGIMSNKVLAYAFSESRGAKMAHELIRDSYGFLTADAYSGYNAVTQDDDEDEAKGGKVLRIRVGCWGHCRRKFYIALKNVPAAREVLEMIVELYVVERDAAMQGVLGTQTHATMRSRRSALIVARVEAWVDEQRGRHAPKSAMGRALTYAFNQRVRLSRFLEDPKLNLDNNYAERALRIIALGRKNFLFAGSSEHAQNFAVLQTIVSTCQLNRVNPYEYIRDVIIRLRDRPPDQIDDLLPWNWKPPQKPTVALAASDSIPS